MDLVKGNNRQSQPNYNTVILSMTMVVVTMVREKGMALTYRFVQRYGLDLPSLILHTLVFLIKSLQQVLFTYSSKDLEIALQMPS